MDAVLLRFVVMKYAHFSLAVLGAGFLPACHVFDDGEISATCDELPGCLEVPVDTGDSGTSVVSAGFGFAVASVDDDGVNYALEYYQGGELIHSLTGLENPSDEGFGEGLEYNSETETFFFTVTPTQLYEVSAKTLEVMGYDSTEMEMTALESDGSDIWAILKGSFQQNIGRIDFSTKTFDKFSVDTSSLDTLFSDGDGGLYLLDRTDVSVFSIDAAAESIEQVISGFDDGSRVVSAFFGPEDSLYSCSSAGAIYQVSDLESGSLVPVVYSEELAGETVGACAYDASTSSYVVVTQAAVYRLGPDGSLEELATPALDSFAAVDFVFSP